MRDAHETLECGLGSVLNSVAVVLASLLPLSYKMSLNSLLQVMMPITFVRRFLDQF